MSDQNTADESEWGTQSEETGGDEQADTGQDDSAGDHQTEGDENEWGTASESAGHVQGDEPLSRWKAAGVGAVVTFLVSMFIPLIGQVVGGAAAGYLRGSDTKESAITGALGGILASIPGALLVLAIVMIFGIGGIAGGEAAGGLGILLFGGAIVVAIVVFSAVVCAVGGVIGAELTDRPAPR